MTRDYHPPVPRLRAILLACVVWGLALGWAAAALGGLVADRDWQHGLVHLAAERASRTVACHAGAGMAGFVLGALAALIGARLVRGGRLGALAWRSSLVAAALPSATWFAWTQRWAAPDTTARALWTAMLALVGAGLMGLLLRRLDPSSQGVRRLAGVVLVLSVPAGALAGFGAIAPYGDVARPSVLLIVLDTVRADRLSSYGYPRPTTPELDAFAREAIRFPRFYSTSSWTLPGHASLFTGLYPMQHGATQEHLRLERRFATLAERLRDGGYATFAATANPVVGAASGLAQGFDRFDEVWRQAPDGVAPARLVNTAFLRFLVRAPRDRPFFAFLNYMEAHRPYRPTPGRLRNFLRRPVPTRQVQHVGERPWYEYYLSEPPQEQVELLSDLYDAELAEVSGAVGEILATLRREGRLDAMLVVVTSDHGENLGEHGHFDHAFSLYETTLRVPLLMRLPGGARAGEVAPSLGQVSDLATTILGVCGVPKPDLASSFDLLSGDSARSEVVAEYYYPAYAVAMAESGAPSANLERLLPHLRRLRAVQVGSRKLIWASDGRHELYELSSDPGETRNLFGDPRSEGSAADLERELDGLLARLASPDALRPPRPVAGWGGDGDRLDAKTAEALRALGYAR